MIVNRKYPGTINCNIRKVADKETTPSVCERCGKGICPFYTVHEIIK